MTSSRRYFLSYVQYRTVQHTVPTRNYTYLLKNSPVVRRGTIVCCASVSWMVDWSSHHVLPHSNQPSRQNAVVLPGTTRFSSRALTSSASQPSGTFRMHSTALTKAASLSLLSGTSRNWSDNFDMAVLAAQTRFVDGPKQRSLPRGNPSLESRAAPSRITQAAEMQSLIARANALEEAREKREQARVASISSRKEGQHTLSMRAQEKFAALTKQMLQRSDGPVVRRDTCTLARVPSWEMDESELQYLCDAACGSTSSPHLPLLHGAQAGGHDGRVKAMRATMHQAHSSEARPANADALQCIGAPIQSCSQALPPRRAAVCAHEGLTSSNDDMAASLRASVTAHQLLHLPPLPRPPSASVCSVCSYSEPSFQAHADASAPVSTTPPAQPSLDEMTLDQRLRSSPATVIDERWNTFFSSRHEEDDDSEVSSGRQLSFNASHLTGLVAFRSFDEDLASMDEHKLPALFAANPLAITNAVRMAIEEQEDLEHNRFSIFRQAQSAKDLTEEAGRSATHAFTPVTPRPHRRGVPRSLDELRQSCRSRGSRANSRRSLVEEIATLKNNCWLENVSPQQLIELYTRGKVTHVKRYSQIMREGDKGSCFFVVLRGVVQVSSSLDVSAPPRICTPGMSFGEPALVLDEHVRQSSATALERTTLLSLSAEAVATVGVELQDLREFVIVNYLSRVPFFRDLSLPCRKELSRIIEVKLFRGKQVIFEEGDEADAMYIVVEGRVQMIRSGGMSQPTVVAETRAQTEAPWFGELAVFNKKPRGATARTVDETKLLMISKLHFKRFGEIVPSFMNLISASNVAVKKINENLSELAQNQSKMKTARRLLTGVGGKWGAMFTTSENEGNDGGIATAPPASGEDRFRNVVKAVIAKEREERRERQRRALFLEQQEIRLREIREQAASDDQNPFKQWQDKTLANGQPVQVGQRPVLLKMPSDAVCSAGLRPTRKLGGTMLQTTQDKVFDNNAAFFG